MKATLARLASWAVIIRSLWVLLDTIVNKPFYPMIYLDLLVLIITMVAGGVILFGIRDEDSYGMVPVIITLVVAVFLV